MLPRCKARDHEQSDPERVGVTGEADKHDRVCGEGHGFASASHQKGEGKSRHRPQPEPQRYRRERAQREG